MPRTRQTAKRIIESSDSEDEVPLKKLHTSVNNPLPSANKGNKNDSSSSESDIENYLQPIDKIDFNSSFFKTRTKNEEEFDKVEKELFAGITRLSDSESDDVDTTEDKDLQEPKQEVKQMEVDSKPSTSGTKLNFKQLEEYTRQIEEAKKHVEKYNAKKKPTKKPDESGLEISNLLAVGESKQITLENIRPEDLHSSDFESCDSEQEDWEEVKTKDSQEVKEQKAIPKEGIQIVVDLPGTCRKKKGVDLLAAMKRRLNRIRKENQVYVHKVHLLCWIAHGNYVNSVINNTEILGLALSLLPSDKCYPSERTDLGYLEQIVQWYKKAIHLVEKPVTKTSELTDILKFQISKKEACNKKIFVYIFIAILRALGIQCRLILSFQVEPLRPPVSELHSLAKDSVKKETKSKKSDDKAGHARTKSSTVKETKNIKADDKVGHAKTTSSVKTSNVVPSNKSEKSKKSKNEERKDKIAVNAELKKDSEAENKLNSKSRTKKTDSSENTLNVKETRKRRSKSEGNKEKTAVEKQDSEANNKLNSKSSTKKSDSSENTLSVKETRKRRSKSEGNNEKTAVEKQDSETNNKLNSKSRTKKSDDTESKYKATKQNGDTLSVKETRKVRSKSESNKEEITEKQDSNKTGNKGEKSKQSKTSNTKDKDTLKKDIIKIKLPKKEKAKAVPQLDGANNSSDEESTVAQLDGANDEEKKSTTKKPNLRKLSVPENTCKVKKHASRLKSLDTEHNSEDDFRPRSPFVKKNTESPKLSKNRKVNLHKLKNLPKNDKDQPKIVVTSPKKQLDVKNDIINLIKGRITEQKHLDTSRKVKKRKSSKNSDSDSDFMPEPIKKKHHDSVSDIDYFVPKPKVKKRIPVTRKDSGLTVPDDSDTDKAGKKKGNNVWAEVFLESEEKWISVDVVRGQVHCVSELFTRATHPVSYIVAWTNNNNVKDITKRYCTNFNTITRKLRIHSKWWEETMKPFTGIYTARDKEEDDDLNRQQLDQPLPKSIAEFKNHPLYALRRHLLKFEEIYPPDILPLGFIRGEAVYPRNCVYVCHSRDIWLKEARVVKPGEKPYKIVKARPKYDKLSNKIITDQLLEIFGKWQTVDYEPPTAENGIVPRNAFGNVELFKSCMLPKGTVHLKLPGLNKVCRKMNIDCASAIVGFDFHGGWSHPTYDGFVVCEEFADVVAAAWESEQEEIEKRENEKIEKRVYGNWKKLIRGLLIRERLKAKYDFGGATTSGAGKEKKLKGPKFCTKK